MMRSEMLRAWVVFGAFVCAAGCVASFNPVLSEAGDAPAQDERADTPAMDTTDGTTTPDAGDGAAVSDLPDTPAVEDASDVRDAPEELVEVELPDIPSPMDVPSDVQDDAPAADIVDVNDVPVIPDVPAPEDVRDVAVEDQGPVCPMATTRCAGACVDTQTNAAHCGACGAACSLPRATAACTGGRCRVGACNANAGDCDANPDNGCEVDLLGDGAHCGRCGNPCGAGRFCSNGACVVCGSAGAPACPPGGTCSGLTNCAGTCRDTATDTNHCGACNRACASGQVCSMGACVSTCSLTLCGGACVDTQTNASHCGACGRPCVAPSGGSVNCQGGSCVQSCPSGQTVCGGVCTAVGVSCLSFGNGSCRTSGVTYCAGSGTACNASPRTSGSCSDVSGGVCDASGNCACPSGQSNCAGRCVSTASDASNCGACGRVCAVGQNCVSGTCTTVCGSSQVLCGGSCMSAGASCTSSGSGGCETAGVTACNGSTVACNATPRTSGSCSFPAGGQCSTTGTCACVTGQVNCGGRCVDVRTDTSNCGACGRACAFANASATCSSGTCVLGSCASGYGNCDGSDTNGCELALTTTANCGACGRTCSFANASAACSGGACQLGRCVMNAANCDGNDANGCETGLYDPANCGRCGNRCTGSPPRCIDRFGTPTCL